MSQNNSRGSASTQPSFAQTYSQYNSNGSSSRTNDHGRRFAPRVPANRGRGSYQPPRPDPFPHPIIPRAPNAPLFSAPVPNRNGPGLFTLEASHVPGSVEDPELKNFLKIPKDRSWVKSIYSTAAERKVAIEFESKRDALHVLDNFWSAQRDNRAGKFESMTLYFPSQHLRDAAKVTVFNIHADVTIRDLLAAFSTHGPIVHLDRKEKEGHVYYAEERQAVSAVENISYAGGKRIRCQFQKRDGMIIGEGPPTKIAVPRNVPEVHPVPRPVAVPRLQHTGLLPPNLPLASAAGGSTSTSVSDLPLATEFGVQTGKKTSTSQSAQRKANEKRINGILSPYGLKRKGKESSSTPPSTKATLLKTVNGDDSPLRSRKRERNGLLKSPPSSSTKPQQQEPSPPEKRSPRYEKLLEQLQNLKSQLSQLRPEDKIPFSLKEVRTETLGMVGMDGVTPLMLAAPMQCHFVCTRRFGRGFRHLVWEERGEIREGTVEASFLLAEGSNQPTIQKSSVRVYRPSSLENWKSTVELSRGKLDSRMITDPKRQRAVDDDITGIEYVSYQPIRSCVPSCKWRRQLMLSYPEPGIAAQVVAFSALDPIFFGRVLTCECFSLTAEPFTLTGKCVVHDPYIACGTEEGRILLWSTKNAAPSLCVINPEQDVPITCVALYGHSIVGFVAGGDTEGRIWFAKWKNDAKGWWHELAPNSLACEGALTCLALQTDPTDAPGRRLLASGTAEGEVGVWDVSEFPKQGSIKVEKIAVHRLHQ
ncbi:hypothetical protein HK097_001007 [Rhizophlyctis rosea]|uniref:RRM domain-containing protein n=1 Tax=Rhizophlyctis rosea TaxID=64517 RepID=A0AAD5WYJ1_9FUNG|nr:hypothetical protein HK097_001007 [Rhizophlyctis rosea]